MGTINALNWRYATKSFDAESTLESDKIDLLKQAFNLTPTSYGLQPLKLLVISDKAIQDKLLPASFNQKQVNTASHVFVICIEKKIDSDFIKNHFELVKEIRETPDEVLNPYREFLLKDFSKKNDEELRQWAKNQAYLVLGNMLTVCAIEKIDACPMEGFLPHQYTEILGLDADKIEPVLVLPVGVRHKDDMFSSMKKVRRPIEDVVIEY
jgi:nitroreductase